MIGERDYMRRLLISDRPNIDDKLMSRPGKLFRDTNKFAKNENLLEESYLIFSFRLNFMERLNFTVHTWKNFFLFETVGPFLKNFLHNNSTKDVEEDRESMFRRDSFPSFAKPSVRRTVITARENLLSAGEENCDPNQFSIGIWYLEYINTKIKKIESKSLHD